MVPCPERKPALLIAVVKRLEQDLAAVTASQKATQAGAVHAESKQENDKDTRAIESGYLARGLAERAESLAVDLSRLRSLTPRQFLEDEPIALGAWVQLTGENGAVRSVLVLPTAGGLTLEFDGGAVQVISPQSPLGDLLIGSELDEEITVTTPRGERTWEISAVV